LSRVAEIAREALPENPTDIEKETAEIDDYNCDLVNPEEVRGVFERYGKGGIWGVIHIAVRTPWRTGRNL
jgi:aldose 1-epimerase